MHCSHVWCLMKDSDVYNLLEEKCVLFIKYACLLSSTANNNVMQCYRARWQIAGSHASKWSLITLRTKYKIRNLRHRNCASFGLFQSREFWIFGCKKPWAVESKTLGTQQRFYTVVSPNLRNICTFLKVNLYTVYIWRRLIFHSSISFVCVCIIYCICNQCGFYPRFPFPPGVAYPLEIKLAHFTAKSCVNGNDSTSVSMWYSSSLCNTGSTPSNEKNKIPSGDRGKDFPCTWKLQDFQGTSAEWWPIQSTLFPFIAQIRFMTT